MKRGGLRLGGMYGEICQGRWNQELNDNRLFRSRRLEPRLPWPICRPDPVKGTHTVFEIRFLDDGVRASPEFVISSFYLHQILPAKFYAARAGNSIDASGVSRLSRSHALSPSSKYGMEVVRRNQRLKFCGTCAPIP